MTSTIYDTLGFNDNPFPPGACRDHYFQTETTKRILEVLSYGIKSHKGFLVFIGEVGLGKTSLLLQLLPLLESDNVRTSWVFNTAVDKYELLQTLVQDYGIKLPETPHLSTLINSLHNFFLQQNREGHNCAIIIDEAHNLDFQCMEALRMLSNLELNGEKLVQILLTGQPELKIKLDQPEMRQLTSRINVFLNLPPLSSEEVAHYVNFKLSAVGSQLYLEEKAHKLLCVVSGGNLRLINLLMEKTMYAMVALGEKRVSRRTVYEGVKDVGAWNRNVSRSLRRITLKQFSVYGGIGAASVLVLAALIFLLLPSRENFSEERPVAEKKQTITEKSPPKLFSSLGDAKKIDEDNAEQDPIIIDDAPASPKNSSPVEQTAAISQQRAATKAPEPDSETELDKASVDFLTPWGLNHLAGPLRKAVREKELDSFILSLPTDKPATKNLRLVPLQVRPPAGKIMVSYFPWQSLTETGDVWIALWQPPVELTRFTKLYNGPEILELQKMLERFGYYTKALDGTVGPGTINALQEFQESRGLEPTGTPDQQTLLWLYLDEPDKERTLIQDNAQNSNFDPSTPPPEPELPYSNNVFNHIPKKKKKLPQLPKRTPSEQLEFSPGSQLPKKTSKATGDSRQQNNTRIMKPTTSPPAKTRTSPKTSGPGYIPNTNQ